jgi:hypothetical protein
MTKLAVTSSSFAFVLGSESRSSFCPASVVCIRHYARFGVRCVAFEAREETIARADYRRISIQLNFKFIQAAVVAR